MITQERVRELFDYHEDGYLIRKVRTSNRVNIGDIVKAIIGCTTYKLVVIDGFSHPLHQAIFLWHYGYIPEGVVDHKDRIIWNNRINNLRDLSYSCNSRNCMTRKNNKSGITGVSWISKNRKWKAYIRTSVKNLQIGYFTQFNNAVKARWREEVRNKYPNCNSSSDAFLYLNNNNLLSIVTKFKRVKKLITS